MGGVQGGTAAPAAAAACRTVPMQWRHRRRAWPPPRRQPRGAHGRYCTQMARGGARARPQGSRRRADAAAVASGRTRRVGLRPPLAAVSTPCRAPHAVNGWGCDTGHDGGGVTIAPTWTHAAAVAAAAAAQTQPHTGTASGRVPTSTWARRLSERPPRGLRTGAGNVAGGAQAVVEWGDGGEC